MPPLPLRRLAAAALTGVALTSLPGGCGAGAEFETRVAPGFNPQHHAVSVIGVYKDGQMSAEAWSVIGPRLASSLGTGGCPAGYALASANGPSGLVAAIDDYARANGPTDDLLAQLAPAAKGDLLLTVTVAGRPPTPEKTSVTGDTGSGGMGGTRGGPAPRPGRRGEHAPIDTNVLDVSASLFSVSAHRSVAEIAMTYSGATVDDALTRFAQRLATDLPGATCAGWDWAAPVDAEHIRASIEQGGSTE
jgi:hypothetical protein